MRVCPDQYRQQKKGREGIMRELYLNCVEQRNGQGATCSFRYYILIDEMDVGPFSCESYGLRVVDTDGAAESSVPNITCSVSKIDALSELVVRQAVSPAHLRDVIEDWL